MSTQENTRRLAAVWFADVAGYVTLSGRDAEAAIAIVAELQRVSQEVVEQHGGLVLSFIGDSAIAAFDSTETAVHAALDVQSAFQSSDIVRRHGSGLRVGVHVGEIVETSDGGVHGDGVNIASRLQAVAETGGVVLSESAARQIEDRTDFELRSLGTKEFKGVRRSMEVYAVRMAGTENAELASEPEDAELSELAKLLADRYRVEHEIGRGGMATVYKAHDIRHDRPVALKVMHKELTDAIGAQRFLREIRVTANLQHPHVLPLFDSGEVGGRLFYVMPMVDGVSLKGRLHRETQLGITDTIKIVRDVASALAHAHERGVIHRDIKPENILFSGDYAVLADFGVARAVTQAAEGGLTHKGLAMGSPPYMAPEQMKDSGTIDGRTDVYALGCVMYEMLVGSPPFTGSTAQVVMARHQTDPVPPIRSVRSNVPEELEAVVMRCLAKVQADRFADASALVAALDAVSRSHAASPSATPQGVAPPLSAAVPQPGPTYPTPSTGQHALSGSYDTDQHSGERSFLGELKRRKVYQAGVIYLVFAMGAVQAAELAFPTFGMAEYFDFLVMAAVLGFPLTIVLSWGYDLTRKGLRRATPYRGTTMGVDVSTTTAHRRVLWLRALGVAGLVLSAVLFPLYQGVTLRKVDLSRGDARIRAEEFLAERGWGGAFKEVSVLDIHMGLNDFLQSEVGLGWSDGRFGERITAWNWRFRWFRPGLTEEWRVSVGSGGRIVYFQHTIPRTQEGESLTEEEARLIAEDFLAEQGIDSLSLTPQGTSGSTLESRTEFVFNWRVSDLVIPWTASRGEEQEGVGRIRVAVVGDRVGRYENDFEVPEGFMRARNARTSLFAVLASLMSLLLMGFAVGVLISTARKAPGTTRWRRALVLGGVIGVLAAGGLTSMIASDALMDLPSDLPAIIGVLLPVGLLMLYLVMFGASFFVFAAVGDSLARRYYPSMLEGWDILCERGWRVPEVTSDISRGIFLAGVLLGLDGLSSYVTTQFPGVHGVVLDELAMIQSAWVPLVASLAMTVSDAMMATVTILAALVLLRRYLKSTVIAVGFLAVGGAFTSDIPVDPIYLTATFTAVEFVVLTIALLRWGPVTLAAGILVHTCITIGAQSFVGGNSEVRLLGVGMLVAGLLPLLYVLLSRIPKDEPMEEASPA